MEGIWAGIVRVMTPACVEDHLARILSAGGPGLGGGSPGRDSQCEGPVLDGGVLDGTVSVRAGGGAHLG